MRRYRERRGSVLSAVIVAALALIGFLFVIDYAIGTHFVTSILDAIVNFIKDIATKLGMGIVEVNHE